MEKLVFFCRRRPDITHAEYERRLLEGHVPLALRHHPTLRRYTVNIVDESPHGWEALDSIGELFFDTFEDFRERLYDSPEGEKIIHRDVAGFMGAVTCYRVEEYVQLVSLPDPVPGERTPGVKFVCPLVRRDGIGHGEFVRHWIERHVPLVVEHHRGLVRYVTNVVAGKLSGDGPELDGIAELHFASETTDLANSFDSPEGERRVREDIARFIGRAAAYRVREFRQK
ncbi:MAG: hypothetical protein KatS3mg076_1993 [Candidatus Binatia bacterium]|nr:MAG: hypothetical protein KatS3mg076_1993 [Candidatus Binatia bacterium]